MGVDGQLCPCSKKGAVGAHFHGATPLSDGELSELEIVVWHNFGAKILIIHNSCCIIQHFFVTLHTILQISKGEQ